MYQILRSAGENIRARWIRDGGAALRRGRAGGGRETRVGGRAKHRALDSIALEGLERAVRLCIRASSVRGYTHLCMFDAISRQGSRKRDKMEMRAFQKSGEG